MEVKRKKIQKKTNRKKKELFEPRTRVILLLILVMIICVSVTKFFYDSYTIVEIRRIPMEVVVSDTLGLGLKEDVMMFGGLSPGKSSSRELIIANYKNESLRAQVKFNGEMSKWVKVERNNFLIKGGEEKRISFFVNVPEGIDNGEYNGDVVIIFKRAL